MGGTSGMNVCGGKRWLLYWVFGRGLCGFGFVKCVFLGYIDGMFLVRVNGCKLWSSDGVLLGKFEWTPNG